MEFFRIFEILFGMCDPYMASKYELPRLSSYKAFIIAGAVYLVIYVFKAIALMTMAKKAGKNKLVWCAFIPFVSTYLLGKLAGETKFFNVKIKNIGLIAFIVELVVTVTCLLSYVPQIYIIEGGYYIMNGLGLDDTVPGVLTLYNVSKVSNIIYSILSWVELFVFVFLYIAIYRKYYTRGHVIFTILSALLPISAFLLFAIRNNEPIDYEKFMKERMERIRRAQQNNPYGPYGNPYNTYGNPYNNPYGNPYNPYGQNAQNPNSQPDDPFGEYSNGEKSESKTQEPTQGQNDSDDDGYFN